MLLEKKRKKADKQASAGIKYLGIWLSRGRMAQCNVYKGKRIWFFFHLFLLSDSLTFFSHM